MNRDQISTLFAADVEVAVATDEMYNSPLFPEEYEVISQSASVRRREFSAGRSAARSALANLGLAPIAIPPDENRVPKWPTGYVGSISHCAGFCCSVVSRVADAQSLGIDVEGLIPLPKDLHYIVFGENELAEMRKDQDKIPFDIYKIGFSAKEAFYKCYYPLSRQFLDFTDVNISIKVTSDLGGEFKATIKDTNKRKFDIAPKIIGRWCANELYVFSGTTIPASR